MTEDVRSVARLVTHDVFEGAGLGRMGWWALMRTALSRALVADGREPHARVAGGLGKNTRRAVADAGVDLETWTVADLDRAALASGAAEARKTRKTRRAEAKAERTRAVRLHQQSKRGLPIIDEQTELVRAYGKLLPPGIRGLVLGGPGARRRQPS
ncbi:hypothetical protein [Oerskovia enterophila]|uniref:Uncharacterized protein n=1 Tax=Oerskovia enterophila TaxID=43678 RepID=A0ABX2YCC0_9CELL|nr:hypothetical protein [Oerskovia enterophila]OCI32606.1 hypothetical protein OERS_05330 [Oerskovia enterophila]